MADIRTIIGMHPKIPTKKQRMVMSELHAFLNVQRSPDSITDSDPSKAGISQNGFQAPKNKQDLDSI